MLTTRATAGMRRKWKRIFDRYRGSLEPNRRTGAETDAYFRAKYAVAPYEDPKFRNAVERNITENECFREKLPEGGRPEVRTYLAGNVRVAIDTVSGYFQVECEEIEKAAPIYDDLFVFRGLDEADLQNYFLVAQYVILTKMET